MMRFDHIGLFVENLNYGYDQLAKLFNIARKSDVYNDPLLKVSVQFLYDETGICYEIIAPYGEGNPVDAVLRSKSRILNHIAYKTNHFEKSVVDLRHAGCIPLGKPQPAIAFCNAKVIFFLSPLNIIFELIEDKHG